MLGPTDSRHMRGGGRGAALAIVAIAMLAPMAGAWTQMGGGPTNSHSILGRAPAADEIAFKVELQADMLSTWGWREPILLGGYAHVVTTEGIRRISLEDGSHELLVTLEGIGKLLSDEERFFVKKQNTVLAFDLDGRPLWESPIPKVITLPEANGCPGATTGAGAVYLICNQFSEDSCALVPDVPAPLVPHCAPDPSEDVLLFALDAATGALLWKRALLADAEPEERANLLRERGAGHWPNQGGLLYTAGRLVSHQGDLASKDGPVRRSLTIHDAETGETLHYIPATESTQIDPTDIDTDSPCRPAPAGVDSSPGSGRFSGPVASGMKVYSLLEDLVSVRIDTGEVEWQVPYDEGSYVGRQAALPGGGVVDAWRTTIRHFDEDGTPTVIHELDSTKMWHWVGATSDATVGVAHWMGSAFPCRALDSEHDANESEGPGRKQWLHVLRGDGTSWSHEIRAGVNEAVAQYLDADPALADGLIVMATDSRTVIVFGRTSASIVPTATVDDAYPGAGETVQVDMSSTRPGLHAPDLEFRADWGDGNVGDWQASPVLTHTYTGEGTFAANFTARNSAGQQSVESTTFFVGGTPPVKENLLSWAFDAERQEYTLFGLGGALTGAIALFGIIVAKRRRSLLQQELKAVDAARGSADADQLLDAAQTRATIYYRERRLDEAQFAVLREHIDQARNAARLGSLDAIASHLPHGVVLALRQILSDGRVNAWEERHVLTLLPPDTPQHVAAQVREALARWRQHDTQDAWGRA